MRVPARRCSIGTNVDQTQPSRVHCASRILLGRVRASRRTGPGYLIGRFNKLLWFGIGFADMKVVLWYAHQIRYCPLQGLW